MKEKLITIGVCFLFSLILLLVIFVSYWVRNRQEEKAEKEKIKKVNKKYEDEKKQNKEIINSIDNDNIIDKLHDLAAKGEQRLHN